MQYRMLIRIMPLEMSPVRTLTLVIPVDVVVSIEKRSETASGNWWEHVLSQDFHFLDNNKFYNLKPLILDVAFDKNFAFLNIQHENKSMQNFCVKRLKADEDTIPMNVYEIENDKFMTYRKEQLGYTYL